MQPNIVFLDEYSLGDADLGSIRALGNYTGYRTTAREEVADRCREADVVITNKVVFRRETLRQLPRLRLICVAATGMNHIDLEAAAELGIAVKNAVGYSTPDGSPGRGSMFSRTNRSKRAIPCSRSVNRTACCSRPTTPGRPSRRSKYSWSASHGTSGISILLKTNSRCPSPNPTSRS